ncbi:sugar phosphate isomerase/epimerase [Halobacillus sp. ACCC02827]|uniref:sugar phosphate isomerase/epimerase family protein n=1 Tax=Halobacillus sp. ACCC02827 TaxID=3052090 RepID=UPI0025709E59|nr:sugar phosphate isomerase/epimerase [Halobacillus sp. ACCC02827]WJE15080.1 sugar phosphate isomerase/epimerase [Halobacillus sp. ACCC02827]
MTKIPVAVQMFTLRNESEKDFKGVLKQVADLGYDGVELAGLGGLQAEEVRETLDLLGLKAASSHIPLDVLEEGIDGVIEEQKILGSKHIVCPYLLPEQRTKEHYEHLVSVLNKAGEKAHAAGITLSYHNHDFELEAWEDGTTPLSYILKETNPEWVKAEFDIYWLTKAGESPAKWLENYQGRTPLVHLKDMTTDGEQFFAELGTGGVDIERVLELGGKNGVEWWIVEQDQSKQSPLDSIAESFQYLQKQNVTSV